MVLPLFGFADAGLTRALDGAAPTRPVALGVAAGLFLGEQAGVMTSAWLAIRGGIARRPAGGTWLQFYGVALLCGIGFTMSLFIGLMAFDQTSPSQDDTKFAF